jgi:tetratricopeptide (TPR) repeat protein
MAEGVTTKRIQDRKVLRLRGIVFMALLLVISVIVYYGFLSRKNRQRLVELYLSRANSSVKHDNYDEAAEALQKASLVDPSNLQVQTEQLKVEIFRITKRYDALSRLMDLESLDRAEENCNQLLRTYPGSTEVIALLGIVYAHKDQPARAFETYKKVMEIDPSYPNVHNYWGRSAVQWGLPDNWHDFSIQKFNEALQLDPTYPAPRINLAVIQVNDAIKMPPASQGKAFETAVETLSKGEQFGQRNEFLYAAWGYALDEWGKTLRDTDKLEAYKKFSAALEKYRIAETINPEVALIHFNKAETLDDLSNGSERADEAIAEYTKALQLQPVLVEAHIAIARLLIKRSGSDQKAVADALTHYNQAIDLTSKTIEQYRIRKSRTTDTHALKLLDEWTALRLKEQANIQDEVNSLNSQSRPSVDTQATRNK